MCLLNLHPSWLVKTLTPLADIISLTLQTGNFPERLKGGMVILLLKKPSLNLSDPANFLQISNVLFLGKVIERVVAKQLQGFLDDASVLD